MSPLRTQCARLPERTSARRQALNVGQAQDPVDTVKSASARHTVSYSRRGGVPWQDPYAYYKAFLNTESSWTADQHGDGGTGSPPTPDAESVLGYAEQQQNKPRPVPYSVAVRFANRSSGAPLTTIAEQGSASTLSSRSSPLRLPSNRIVQHASPGCASRMSMRSRDEAVINSIHEEDQDERTFCRDTDLDVPSEERRGNKSESCNVKATAAVSASLEYQMSTIPRLPELGLDMESKGVKGFLRGVLTKVRSNTRSRSRSSSSTDLPVPKPNRWSDASPPSQSDRNAGVRTDPQRPLDLITASTTLLRSTPSLARHVSKHPATHGSSPTVRPKPSADLSASTPSVSPSTSEPELAPVGLRLPPIPDLSRIQYNEEACSVPPQPRDAALDPVRHAATTVSSRSRDELTTRPDGASARRNNEWSLDGLARNASLNASFCSSMSTSYSGTVLGIDLDIQHDFPHTTRRSVTPVWFTPEETEMVQVPNRGLQAEGVTTLPHRSGTSPALMSLLPIAAAEGIVQQNFTTPQLAFYSPSGNLVQARDASPMPTSASSWRSNSYLVGTPPTTTLYHNDATATSAMSMLSSAVASLPARPAPASLTTPLQSTAPLPEHLRHQLNFHKVDRLQTESMHDSEIMLPSRVVITSNFPVPGCDGVVREGNLVPPSGVLQSPQKHSKIGSSISCLCIGDENRLAFHTSSLLGSKGLSRPRTGYISGRKLRKKGNKLKKRQDPRSCTVLEQATIGPIAGHALRVCFCQPYDGVGSLPGELGCGGVATTQLGGFRDETHASPTRVRESTPNARIVAEGNGKGRGRARRDSVVSVGALGR
jgi:hypothetical protein